MPGTWATGWASGNIPPAAEFAKSIAAVYDTTLAASAATIDITNIPQLYGHLVLICYARIDSAVASDFLLARFNSDTGTNYDFQQLYGQAATVTSQESFGNTAALVGHVPGASAAANLFSSSVVLIPHYAGASNNKLARSNSGIKTGTATTNMQTYERANFWRSNNAITQITVLPNGAANFVAGTRVSAYVRGF